MILCTLVLSTPGRAADAIDIDQLVSPFRGFDHAHMELVFDLFGQETQGRLLLRQARRKLNVSAERDLTEIFCFCEPADLGIRGTRRGLFTQETGNYYREKGESEWHALNPGGDEKLRDGERFPIVARREHQTRGFEFLDVAFLPRICIRRGLSVAQTYLVLFHELIHLVGLDPFEEADLLRYRGWEDRDRFYRDQMTKEGGEVDAFLAQINAFQRLKKRHGLEGLTVLETFLTGEQLRYRERDAFLDHLLIEADYASELNRYLEDQVRFQYNRSFSWWEYFGKVMAALDEQLEAIDHNITVTRDAVAVARARDRKDLAEEYLEEQLKWERQRILNRRRYELYVLERKDHRKFMAQLDELYPAP
ncbi:hypothetical protein [Sulfidibacter corallicola]